MQTRDRKRKEPGIYHNVPYATYRQWDGINYSTLWEMCQKTPMHARYYQEHGRKETPALLWGRLLDILTLEPLNFSTHFIVMPKCDRRTKQGKADWEEFQKAVMPGQSVVTQEQYNEAFIMAQEIRKQPGYKLVAGGQSQISIVWDDPVAGVRCKTRIDYMIHNVVTDFKTSTSAARQDWEYSIGKWGYYLQAAMHVAACECAMDFTPEYNWLVVEKELPYATNILPCGGRTLEAGELCLRRCLRQWKTCLENDHWPGYWEAGDPLLPIDMRQWIIEAEGANRYNMEEL